MSRKPYLRRAYEYLGKFVAPPSIFEMNLRIFGEIRSPAKYIWDEPKYIWGRATDIWDCPKIFEPATEPSRIPYFPCTNSGRIPKTDPKAVRKSEPRSKSDPESDPARDPKWTENSSKCCPENGPKSDPKVIRESSRSYPKSDPKWTRKWPGKWSKVMQAAQALLLQQQEQQPCCKGAAAQTLVLLQQGSSVALVVWYTLQILCLLACLLAYACAMLGACWSAWHKHSIA